MKSVYLMRHGDAPQAKTDAARMLSDLGRDQCRSVASKISSANIAQVITSDYQRAIDSGSELSSALGLTLEPVQSELLRPGANVRVAVDFICEKLEQIEEEALFVVFHLPIISEVASVLVDGDMRQHYSFPCASILELKVDIPAPGLFEKVDQYFSEY